ncbi:Zinc ion binding protein, partial [Globisporangium splendens]
MPRILPRDPPCRQWNVKCTRVFKQHFFTSGRHYWEVWIRAMGDAHSVVVGIAPAAHQHHFEQHETLSDAVSVWTRGAIGYAATGAIIQNGRVVGHVEPFRAGDTVGVCLDMTNQCAAFFLNGREQQLQKAPVMDMSSCKSSASCSSSHDTKEEDDEDEQKEEEDDDDALSPQKDEGIVGKCAHVSTFRHHAVFAALTFCPKTDDVELYRTDFPW